MSMNGSFDTYSYVLCCNDIFCICIKCFKYTTHENLNILFITFNSLAWLWFTLPTMPSLLTAMEISRAPGLPSLPSEVTVAVTECPVPRQVAASDRPGLQSWLLINLGMPAWQSRLSELVCYHCIKSKCGISEKQSVITLVRPGNTLGTISISTSFFYGLNL